MSQKEEKTTDIKEALLSAIYLQEALINVLDGKGIVKKSDILKELEEVKKGVGEDGLQKRMSKENKCQTKM